MDLDTFPCPHAQKNTSAIKQVTAKKTAAFFMHISNNASSSNTIVASHDRATLAWLEMLFSIPDINGRFGVITRDHQRRRAGENIPKGNFSCCALRKLPNRWTSKNRQAPCVIHSANPLPQTGLTRAFCLKRSKLLFEMRRAFSIPPTIERGGLSFRVTAPFKKFICSG